MRDRFLHPLIGTRLVSAEGRRDVTRAINHDDAERLYRCYSRYGRPRFATPFFFNDRNSAGRFTV